MDRSFSGLIFVLLFLAIQACPVIAHHHGPHENGSLFDSLGVWMASNQSEHGDHGLPGNWPAVAGWMETEYHNRSLPFIAQWSEAARTTMLQMKVMLENFKAYMQNAFGAQSTSSRMTRKAMSVSQIMQNGNKIFQCVAPEHRAMFAECERISFPSQNATGVSAGSSAFDYFNTQLNGEWLTTVAEMNHSFCQDRSTVAVNGRVHLVLPMNRLTDHSITQTAKCAVRERVLSNSSCLSQCFLKKLRDAHKLEKSANASSLVILEVIRKSKLTSTQQEKARNDFQNCLFAHRNSSLLAMLRELGGVRPKINDTTVPIRTNCLLSFKPMVCLLQVLSVGCSEQTSAAFHEAPKKEDASIEDSEWFGGHGSFEADNPEDEDHELLNHETSSEENEGRLHFAQHRHRDRGHHHHRRNCSSSSTTQAATTVTTMPPPVSTVPLTSTTTTAKSNTTTPGVKQPLRMTGSPSDGRTGIVPGGIVPKQSESASGMSTRKPTPGSVTAYRHNQGTISSKKPEIVGVAYRHNSGGTSGNINKTKPFIPVDGSDDLTEGEAEVEDANGPVTKDGTPAYRYNHRGASHNYHPIPAYEHNHQESGGVMEQTMIGQTDQRQKGVL